MNTSKLINVCISIIKVIKLKYLLTNFSAFFAIALVTAIGLTSDSTCLGGKSFGAGVILEIFHCSGIMP